MSPKKTDLRARVGELEATVSGLTQELVEANERIRQLEAVLEETEPETERIEPGELTGAERNGESTKQMGDEAEADGETTSDLDDIIVA